MKLTLKHLLMGIAWLVVSMNVSASIEVVTPIGVGGWHLFCDFKRIVSRIKLYTQKAIKA